QFWCRTFHSHISSPVSPFRERVVATCPIGEECSAGSGRPPRAIHFVLPRALKPGSSGGCTDVRCHGGSRFCCPSSWSCFTRYGKRRSSSSRCFFSCCSLHRSWPHSSLRESAIPIA